MHEHMSGPTDLTEAAPSITDPGQTNPQQLRLLDTSDLPLQHRLDLDTRQRGLAHVAAIRRILAEQAARHAA
jgi:hypothetical protein